jgi:hypothetical protein
MIDLYKEHDKFHYSDDWANLKDECSECYKQCLRYKNGRSIEDVALHNLEVLSGRNYDHYILNRDYGK